MRIFVLPGAPTCDNLGDLGMLQVALERLGRRWPDARIEVLTRDPAGLGEHCPNVEPVPWTGRNRWLKLQALPGSVFGRVRPEIRRQFQLSPQRVWGLVLLLLPRQRRRMRRFAEALFNADLVVLSGCGLLADPFAYNACQMLQTLAAAQRAGLPTALLSQGLGPMSNPELRSWAGLALPQAGYIFVREGRVGPGLLEALGVPKPRVAVTGDDTVELAFRQRPAHLGAHLGVNVRLASYAQANHQLLAPVREVLQAQATQRHVRLVGLPVTRQGESSDVRSLAQLLDGVPTAVTELEPARTPIELIRRVAQCRVVVTGSYHAAVFALAQGIPAVALARSTYYDDKFRGLAELFEGGCQVLDPGKPDFGAALHAAVEAAWARAAELRPRLLAAAQRQVEAARRAYEQLAALVSAC